jgi:hypothetical protein
MQRKQGRAEEAKSKIPSAPFLPLPPLPLLLVSTQSKITEFRVIWLALGLLNVL